ncbi:MAG: leucine-rich repeat domain-containing protein [Clostridiaceae bacterium]
MKRTFLLMLIMLLIASAIVGCHAPVAEPTPMPPSAPPQAQPTVKPSPTQQEPADYTVEWTDRIVEFAVRDYLNKQEGDIKASELDGIHTVIIKKALTAVNQESISGSPAMDKYTMDKISCADFRHFKNLTSLDISGYAQISDIDRLSGLTNLTEAAFNAPLHDLSGVLQLTALKKLTLRNTGLTDFSALSALPSLQVLDLSYNRGIDLSGLKGLTGVTGLSVTDCALTDIGALSALTELTILDLSWNNIASIDALSALTKLNSLDLSYNYPDSLNALAGLTGLTRLHVSGCKAEELYVIAGLSQLESLGLTSGDLTSGDLGALAGLTKLKELDLFGNQIDDLTPLSSLTSLEKLDLSANIIDGAHMAGKDPNKIYFITDVAPLAKLTNLTDLDLSLNKVLPDLSPLSGLTKLETLKIRGLSYFIGNLKTVAGISSLKYLRVGLYGSTLSMLTSKDLAEISGMTGLESLDISGAKLVSDLSTLSGLTNLKYLDASLTAVKDLTPLKDLTNLEFLNLTETDIFLDVPQCLAPLSGLVDLEYLYLSHTTAARDFVIDDLSPLAGMTKLRMLTLSGIKVSDLSPLSGIKTLRFLNLKDAVYDTPEVVDMLSRSGCTLLTSK